MKILTIFFTVFCLNSANAKAIMTYDGYLDKAEKFMDINSPKDAIPLLKKAISIKQDYWKGYRMMGCA